MPYSAILFSLLLMVGVFVMGGVMFLWRYSADRSGKRNPLSRNLLRSPGESLRAEIEDVQWDIAAFLAVGMLPLPLALGLYLGTWVTEGRTPGIVVAGLSVILAVGMQSWVAWKLWRSLSRLRMLRLGHDAEVAVGQELGELGRSGYRIFHDFPVDEREFNIDHVVVGAAGVFAVETKGRSKPVTRRSGKAAWEVQYDGKCLQFPGWVETEPLRQAVAAADWFRGWLSSAVGERISVEPVLALPGWYVRRTSPVGIPVISGGQIQAHFAGLRRDMPLCEKLIQQIVHQIEQRCRSVPPSGRARIKDRASSLDKAA